jgi:hypothetical protein
MLKVALLACMVALALPVQAQTKKELVAKLVKIQQPGIENVGRAIAAQNAQRALQAAGQALGGVPKDKRDAVAKDIQADVKKFYDEVEPVLRERAVKLAPTTFAPLYEERLSEAELKQVIAWMESPVSKKVQQIDADLGKSLAQKIVEDARPAIEPKFQALEQQIRQRLQTNSAAQPAPDAT